jgi:L-lactate permease
MYITNYIVRSSIIESFIWIAINVFLIWLVDSREDIKEIWKIIWALGLVMQNISYVLLYFLDPGTIF